MMFVDHPLQQELSRRAFLGSSAVGLGQLAWATLLAQGASARTHGANSTGLSELPHFAPRAKRVICLFQSGGFSHVDLFDGKPSLAKFHGAEIPPSVKGDQRLTGMTSGQSAYPVIAPIATGRRCGKSGAWISDLLPHLQGIADELCIIRSMNTEAINHDPAITYLSTGNQQPGYASLGAWVSYGLGTENANLPTYVAMLSQGSGKNPGQPIFARLWGSGFLPSSHQGVGLRPGANPILYLQNPPGVPREARREMLNSLAYLNRISAQQLRDPDTIARLDSYEMAFRMQVSVPELTDFSDETAAVLARYGPEAGTPGSYASNCLLARRLLERDVRFVQLFHRGWDQHIAIREQLPRQCRDVDQPTAALITDLRERGLLQDTLVVFATEFGRTVFSQGTPGNPAMGRDHHGRCFSIWLAGGGIRPGVQYGQTDDFCYNIAQDPVHLRDLHATLLDCLGIDHERFTYPFRGLDVRLTGVEPASVVRPILS
jgi:uncharacterized protein (DUF1501 family)